MLYRILALDGMSNYYLVQTANSPTAAWNFVSDETGNPQRFKTLPDAGAWVGKAMVQAKWDAKVAGYLKSQTWTQVGDVFDDGL